MEGWLLIQKGGGRGPQMWLFNKPPADAVHGLHFARQDSPDVQVHWLPGPGCCQRRRPLEAGHSGEGEATAGIPADTRGGIQGQPQQGGADTALI